jgi:hypothetical protein
MQVLTCEEINQVSGGNWALQIVLGLTVNTIWQAVGELEGVISGFNQFNDYMTDYAQRSGARMLLDPAIFSYAD